MDTKLNQKRERKGYISVLNAISCVAVVMLHTNNCFWEFSRDGYWLSANVIECLMYFAVPIFFMITGINLLDYRDRYSTKEYFKKRIIKTFIPFVFWSILGLGIMILKQVLKHKFVLSDYRINNIISKIINTEIVSYYWFFIPLFTVYLIIPVLSAVSKDRRKIFTYLAVVCFVFNLAFPFVCSITKTEYNNEMYVMSGYIIYALVGYLLKDIEFKPSQKAVIIILGIGGFAIHLFGTYFASVGIGTVSRLFKGYLNIPAFFYSVAVFVVIKDLCARLKSNSKFLAVTERFNKYSLCIYLLQYYAIMVTKKLFEIAGVTHYSLIYRLGGVPVVILICISVTFVARKLLRSKYLFP